MTSCTELDSKKRGFKKEFNCKIKLGDLSDNTIEDIILPGLRQLGWNFGNQLARLIENK